MNAVKIPKLWKPLILCFSMLLFLFSYDTSLHTQTRLSKPSGLNSWKPAHLLPAFDNIPIDSVVRTNFTITMRDGVIIDCLKWVPASPAPAGGWPTVIMHHGYGDNKETLSEFCRLQAQYGYYTMSFSARGQGLSGGLSNLISTTEAQDMIEIANWVKSDSVNGSGPGRILIMGGSQGGAVPFMAACMGMNVAAIISSVAPPNFASSWIENGCIKMTLLWTIEYTPDTARYNSLVNRMSDWVYSDTKQYWDSLNYWLPRDRDFITMLPNCRVPVMIEAAWQDKFFNADGWIQNIHQVTGAPMTSYLGAVQGHGADHSATEDIWHMNWFNNWFFQWLWGMNTTILDEAKYQYASTKFPVVNNQYFTFVHDSSRTLLKNISTPMRLYFGKSGKLRTTPQTGSNTEEIRNVVKNNYTLTQAVNEEFKGTNFNNKFKIDTNKFISDALTADLEWTGAPVIKVDFKSSASTFAQLNYQIYEVLPSGERRFINRANYTDRNYVRSTRRQATFKGQAHSHIFKAGSRILVIISNFDRAHTDASFFGTNPFVLPVMKNGDHTVYLSANSYIELPVVSSAPHELIFNETTDELVNSNPYSFELSQNYPNPFNPATVIEYSIASQEKVSLKVFDLLGREVSTLVNDIQNPGSYSITFNGANLSSGVYFYKLTAGSFTSIKRMILVK